MAALGWRRVSTGHVTANTMGLRKPSAPSVLGTSRRPYSLKPLRRR